MGFDPDSASWRGIAKAKRASAEKRGVKPEADPSLVTSDRAVVLIDEIDKADPDVPNDLLEPLGNFRFRYGAVIRVRAKAPPLVVITTNEERDLPRAFIRRCVVHTLEQPKPERLLEIAKEHGGKRFNQAQYDAVLAKYKEIRTDRIKRKVPAPSLAELLDALAACRSLKTSPQSEKAWAAIALNLLDKATAIPDDRP